MEIKKIILFFILCSSFSAHAEKTKIKFEQGKDYKYDSKGRCKSFDTEPCLDAEEYKIACQKSQGITSGALKEATVLASDKIQQLAKGGSIDKINVYWNESSNKCIVDVVVSGIYNGNSSRESAGGTAYSFIVNDKKQLLVRTYFMPGWGVD